MTDPLTFAQIGSRFLVAVGLTSAVCLIVGYMLLKTTGVPDSYPPLSSLPILSGTVGGSVLVALGYILLWALVRDQNVLVVVFVTAGAVLLLASFHLPYRLSYTKSPRFAGVTVAAQIGQGLLHTLVAGLGVLCFLWRGPKP